MRGEQVCLILHMSFRLKQDIGSFFSFRKGSGLELSVFVPPPEKRLFMKNMSLWTGEKERPGIR